MVSIPRRRRALAGFAGLALAAAGLLAGCSGSSDSTDSSSSEAPAASSAGGDTGDTTTTTTYKVAVLMASSQNGYNDAVYRGAKQAAEALGNVEVTGLDGQFDSDAQFSQIENAASQYDGIIIVPNDGVSLAGAFPLSTDIPVVTVLNPIGPDIHEMEPQVEGVVQTIAQDVAYGATKQAEAVAAWCEDKDPCKVAIITGQSNTTLDVTRVEAFQTELAKHSNIVVVGVGEGKWDRDASATAMANLLQGDPDVNAVLSQGDQMIFGAEIALEEAGLDTTTMYLVGGGGSREALQRVRDGKWGMTQQSFPFQAGEIGMENLYKYLQGETIATWVDQDELMPGNDAYATKETLALVPDWLGDWDG
jgi:ribose transport system substrate-binding protein